MPDSTAERSQYLITPLIDNCMAVTNLIKGVAAGSDGISSANLAVFVLLVPSGELLMACCG